MPQEAQLETDGAHQTYKEAQAQTLIENIGQPEEQTTGEVDAVRVASTQPDGTVNISETQLAISISIVGTERAQTVLLGSVAPGHIHGYDAATAVKSLISQTTQPEDGYIAELFRTAMSVTVNYGDDDNIETLELDGIDETFEQVRKQESGYAYKRGGQRDGRIWYVERFSEYNGGYVPDWVEGVGGMEDLLKCRYDALQRDTPGEAVPVTLDYRGDKGGQQNLCYTALRGERKMEFRYDNPGYESDTIDPSDGVASLISALGGDPKRTDGAEAYLYRPVAGDATGITPRVETADQLWSEWVVVPKSDVPTTGVTRLARVIGNRASQLGVTALALLTSILLFTMPYGPALVTAGLYTLTMMAYISYLLVPAYRIITE